MTYRGAVGADPLAGDGAGILIQMPDALLFRAEAKRLNIALPPLGSYGVGIVFFAARVRRSRSMRAHPHRNHRHGGTTFARLARGAG